MIEQKTQQCICLGTCKFREGKTETFFIRVWKPLPSIRVGNPERESPKRTISTNVGLELLQMVSELDTGRCASKEAEP